MTPVRVEAEKSIRSATGNNMTEEQRQKAKEEAVLLALRNDMALIRRELEVYGMKKDGSTEFISKSIDYDLLWEDALRALQAKFMQK